MSFRAKLAKKRKSVPPEHSFISGYTDDSYISPSEDLKKYKEYAAYCERVYQEAFLAIERAKLILQNNINFPEISQDVSPFKYLSVFEKMKDMIDGEISHINNNLILLKPHEDKIVRTVGPKIIDVDSKHETVMCKESTFKSVRNINTRETSCRFAGEERGVFGIRTQFWQVQHSCIGEQSKDNLPMDYKPCDPATCKFLPWSDLFFISKATLGATKVVRIDHPEYGLSIQAWGDKMPNAIKLKSPARFLIKDPRVKGTSTTRSTCPHRM